MTALGTTSLQVTWAAPNDNGAAITDYDIQYRVGSSGGWTDAGYDGTGTTTTVTGLTAATTYQVQVRATNSEGTSDWSPAGTGTTDDPAATAPDAPAVPTVTALGTTRLQVSWTTPNNNGAAITDYDVEYRVGSSGGWTDWPHTGTDTTTTIDNLTAATEYQVQVRATNSEGTSNWSTPGTGTTDAATAPDAPAAPTVTGLSPTRLQVSWTTPNNNGAAITDYDVEYRVGSSGGWTDWPHTGTDTTTTIDNLTAATEYQVQVRATNSEGTSNWSTPGTGTTNDPAATAPDAPAAPTVTGLSPTRLQVTWTAPNDNGATLSDYDVQYRLQNAQTPLNWPHTGTDTTTTITGLTAETTYQVRVRATNSEGGSPWSNWGVGTTGAVTPPSTPPTPPTATAPDAPAVPTVTALGTTRLQVTWSAPNDNGAAITDYDVQYRVGSSGGWTDAGYDGTDTTTPVTGLRAATTYQVQVRATNREGTSDWSTAGRGRTDDPAATAPDAPAVPTVTALSPTRLQVTWTAPNDNGAAITDYDVQYRVGSSGGWTDAGYDGTDTTTPVTGLTAETTYQVRVRATNRAGTSDWSPAGRGRTDAATAPDAPAVPTVTALSPTSLQVTWTAPNDNGATISDYDVQYRVGSSGDWTDAGYDGTDTTTPVTGLTAETTYQVRVRATNSEGTSDWSPAGRGRTDAATAPDAPAVPTVTALSPTRLQVTWTAPNDNGAPILDYDVQYRVGGSGGWTDAGYDGTDTTTAITGLTAATPYQVRVRATNSVGNSLWSNGANAATPSPTAPDVPAAPIVTALSSTSLQFSWVAPNDNGAPISDYDVQYRVGGSGGWTDANYDSTYTITTITGLTAATPYQVRVRATNRAGTSDWSPAGTGTTNDPAVPPPVFVDPVPPPPSVSSSSIAPDFGDATIANVLATRHQQIPGCFLPEATDADSDALTYSISPDVPAGLTFNAETRVFTGAPTVAMAETAYTYKVEDPDGNSDTIGFSITVDLTPPVRGATTIPGKGYVVYVRDLENAPDFGAFDPPLAEYSAMPNLYEFFTEGGGSLQLNVTGVSRRQVVFSEVMWAVDEGQVGEDGYDNQQWIEIHNTTQRAVPLSAIGFETQAGSPAEPQGTDLISSVMGGRDWIPTRGQNGNSGAADGSGQKAFISMYRKWYDGDGWLRHSWAASSAVYHLNHKGTPGSGEAQDPRSFAPSDVALTTIFNEIGNYPRRHTDHEWIELRIKNGDPSFENWTVSLVTSAADRDIATHPKQTRLLKLPKLNTGRYDDILLITKTDPVGDANHPLRGGYNVEKALNPQKNEGRDANIRYYVADDWTTDLPDHGEFVLILRHGDQTNAAEVEDLAGYHPNLKVDRADFFSNLWPLIGYPAANLSENKIAAGLIHRRVFDDIPGTLTTHGNRVDEVAFSGYNNGWTGIGYKRNAMVCAQNGGTPGYPNNALQSNETQAGAGPVIISEIMYATGNRVNLPQWIELRNTSQSVGVNLDGWRISIVNHHKDAEGQKYAGDLVQRYNLTGKLPPGQTSLIVAYAGRDHTNLPSQRILKLRDRRGRLLNPYGFQITLETKGQDDVDANRKMADSVGNLSRLAANGRLPKNPESYETPAWMLPAGTTVYDQRISIVRVSHKDGTPLMGHAEAAWKRFHRSAHTHAPESTYYGHRNDLSSPGYTVGGVLPVSLSKFRPERLATGEVVVRWRTESELNNAGFNILRGEAIDAEFTKLNKRLIEGQGTTSEKTDYAFTDTSAKPNVVYYYQIQDVSFDGKVQTLRTTHLRGNVTAVDKLPTTWGELKAAQ